ncbi:hypothetical protein HPP92_003704 [Vanilla planifolia]|uniref:Transmembrane protein n=1 Tax=Vanilla planifolia TaxID=51239 RepID=A0A835VJM5_VANPL|nr:hypothetical protein HPP92_004156 [Vanilla planifolia]KAG0503632.1 hypothetical protein HPP92_003704 [Vanilla planifolia]
MSGPTSTEKLAVLSLALLAVMSPLYIGQKRARDAEDDELGSGLALFLPVLLLLLVAGVSLTCFVDQRFTRFDPYWIHRVGGSSCGIFTCLLVLGFVLKCKASLGA